MANEMMRLKWDPVFPETFKWGSLDSRVASELGERLTREVQRELKEPSEGRHSIAGLRMALRHLWEVAAKVTP